MIESCYVVTVTSVVSGASGPIIYGSYSRTVPSTYSGVTVVPSHPERLRPSRSLQQFKVGTTK